MAESSGGELWRRVVAESCGGELWRAHKSSGAAASDRHLILESGTSLVGLHIYPKDPLALGTQTIHFERKSKEFASVFGRFDLFRSRPFRSRRALAVNSDFTVKSASMFSAHYSEF